MKKSILLTAAAVLLLTFSCQTAAERPVPAEFVEECNNRYQNQILEICRALYPESDFSVHVDCLVARVTRTEESKIVIPVAGYEDGSLVRDRESKKVIYVGTGVHPEGPAGVEGHLPDGYKDPSHPIFETSTDHHIERREISSRVTESTWTGPAVVEMSVLIIVKGKSSEGLENQLKRAVYFYNERFPVFCEVIPASSEAASE